MQEKFVLRTTATSYFEAAPKMAEQLKDLVIMWPVARGVEVHTTEGFSHWLPLSLLAIQRLVWPQPHRNLIRWTFARMA